MARRDVERIAAEEADAEHLIQLAREGRQIVRLITHAVDPGPGPRPDPAGWRNRRRSRFRPLVERPPLGLRQDEQPWSAR